MVHRSELLHTGHFERHYRRLSPSPGLNDLVAYYFKLEGYQEIPQGVAEHLLPQLESRLIFAMGNSCLYRLPGEELLRLNGPHLLAPRQHPLACLHPESKGLIGVVFRPGGQSALLNHFQQQPGLSVQPLPELSSLESALATTADFETQASQLNTWLLGLKTQPEDNHLLHSALKLMENGEGVAEAAAAVGLAPRSLQRHCQKLIGLSPRTCQRILRLRGTLTRMWSQPEYSVWDSPYYDYAHFFREFRSFTGMSPEAYLKQFERV